MLLKIICCGFIELMPKEKKKTKFRRSRFGKMLLQFRNDASMKCLN